MSAPPSEHVAYLELLHRLQSHGVRFALTGSFALRLLMDALGGEPVPDCDLLLEPSADNLQRWAALLVEDGWSLAVWNEPLGVPLELETLRGKYYVRARKGPLVLDGTYEHDTLETGTLVSGARRSHGLPVMDLDTLLALKRERGTPRDLEQVARVEHWRREHRGR
ncbi:hypothetical protein D187_009776 [Cystobacter fuscus DSM 2262]|uniref:Nucleotidyltransferase family protein n=1 Tax=Cystobacter fuscus (strain ATCC 25194 / DSM 2262 / NBRC 100088 / M29) TaxID=1242864 RepID=S9P5K3_CYSF2|nr:hypothetical protein [Cystobacter fuscus]EPX57502.1 hypothetical protein D187_009776 [Cystobacter fuscus DSM 2262]